MCISRKQGMNRLENELYEYKIDYDHSSYTNESQKFIQIFYNPEIIENIPDESENVGRQLFDIKTIKKIRKYFNYINIELGEKRDNKILKFHLFIFVVVVIYKLVNK